MTKRNSTITKHILLVSRPAVEGFPPTLNQAAILEEQGLQVSIADESRPEAWRPGELPRKIQRYSLAGGPTLPGRLGRFLKPVWFRQKAHATLKRLKPDFVITYAPDACHPLGALPGRYGARQMWHMHELPEKRGGFGFSARAHRYVIKHAGYPDILSIPDRGRADELARLSGLDAKRIRLIQNCPRPVRTLPAPNLRDLLGPRVAASSKIVLYHGAVGPDHALEIAVRSISGWPSNSVFVMKGRAKPGFRAHVESLAQATGVAERVIFLDPGFQSTASHYQAIAGADLGWTVLEPTSDNWEFGSAACNKRYECMALGIPQIADRLLHVPELIERGECGLCVPHNSPEAAAAAVTLLLQNDGLRDRMGAQGRALHLQRYNYDSQFEPVLEAIQRLLRGGSNQSLI